MTSKSRYFLTGSASILLLGIGGGLFAYYTWKRVPGPADGLPAELRFVPADAALVAYADVHAVMASDMRRELERLATGQRRGQQQIHEFAGIDIEKNVNHVVAYMEAGGSDTAPSRVLMLAQGTFDQAKVEQFITDHGGSVEDYHGKHILTRKFEPRPTPQTSTLPQPTQPGSQPVPEQRQQPNEDMAIAFVQDDLVAMGSLDLVRKALDGPGATAPTDLGMPITTNSELMKLVRDASSGNAWMVGRFEAMSRRMRLPAKLRQQVPPLRFVSASARIDGGVKATIKAETADEAAANQLRDVVRGAISLARLQAGSKPELQDTFKSIELGGSGSGVELSFLVTSDAVRAIAPKGPVPTPPAQPKQ